MTPFTLTINRLAGLGDGIGEYNGLPIFVPKTCAGDEIEVALVKQTTEFYRGELTRVISAGPARVPAPCPHYAHCGGCSLQHLDTETYQNLKRDMVTQALGYSGYADVVPTFHFLPANIRRRADFKIHEGKLAYMELGSHDLTPIESCLILTPALQALIAPINALLPKLPRLKTVALTLADNGVDMRLGLLPTALPLPENEQKMLREFSAKHKVARISFDDGKNIIPFIADTPLVMKLGEYSIPLPLRAFLQASAEAQSLMTELTLKHLKTCHHVVDLFAGMGTYSFPLSRYGRVVAVENDKAMVETMKHLSKSVGPRRRDLFLEPLNVGDLSKFDGAVINPPRAGAKAQVALLAKSNIKKIVLISCNPATWSRDAKTLREAGYKLETLTAIDQFVYAPHVELVSVFTK